MDLKAGVDKIWFSQNWWRWRYTAEFWWQCVMMTSKMISCVTGNDFHCDYYQKCDQRSDSLLNLIANRFGSFFHLTLKNENVCVQSKVIDLFWNKRNHVKSFSCKSNNFNTLFWWELVGCNARNKFCIEIRVCCKMIHAICK